MEKGFDAKDVCMTDISNLTGLEKPLVKLIETIGEGVGVIGNDIFKFDSRKIKRIGEAQAEADKLLIIKKAEADAEALSVLDRATKRFALEQYNKQINLENIVVQTKEQLQGQSVSDKPVDRDWSAKFISIAQDVSRDEVKTILSRILTHEVIRPGSFSLRTLSFLQNTSQQELLLLKKICLLSDGRGVIHVTKASPSDGFFNIPYIELMEMIELGFLKSGLNTSNNLDGNNNHHIYPLTFNNKITYIFQYPEVEHIRLPVLLLTNLSKELMTAIDFSKSEIDTLNEYIKELILYFATKKIQLSKI